MGDRSPALDVWLLRVAGAASAAPGRWLAANAAITFVLGLGLLQLELRTDGATLQPARHPVVEHSRLDARTFRDVERAIVLLRARPGGPAVESRAGLARIQALHTALAALPSVDPSRVRSLADLLDPRPGISIIETPRFLDEIPDDEAGYRALLRRIRASPLAPGLFLSPDGRSAALYVALARGASRTRLVEDLERFVHGSPGGDFEISITGPVTAEVLLGRAVLRDLTRLVPLMLAVMALLLFVCLRCPGGVLVPLAELGMVLVWTLGLMGWLGAPVTLVTTILPVLLLAVSVADEIHLLERVHAYLAASHAPVADSRARLRAALLDAVRDVGRPIALTSSTTSLGFLSFLTASLEPLRDFGLFAAFGVLAAMVLSFAFVPALVVLLPPGWLRPHERAHRARLPAHERMLARHGNLGLALGLAALLLALPGFARLRVQDAWVDNFEPDSSVATAQSAYDAAFWGAYRVDLVLRAPRPFFWLEPDGLRLVERIATAVERGPHVGGVAHHGIAYQIVADAWNEPRPVHALPAHRVREIAQLLNRVQRTTDLDQVLRNDGSAARVRAFVKDADHVRGAELERYLERQLAVLLDESGVRLHVSGDLPLARAVVDSVVGDLLRSAAGALVGVFLVIAIFERSLLRAARVLVPLLAGLPIVLGALGFLGVPLGIATSTFVAVAIGVAVDFAIHFAHAYERERDRPGAQSPAAALLATLASAGRAIRWNAVVLALGLLVLGASTLPPNRRLGLLLAATVLICYATTLLLLPPLLARRQSDETPETPGRPGADDTARSR